jgi:hypothetical protein
VACPALNIFPLYLISGKIFGGKKVIEHKISDFRFSLQILPEEFLILGRTKRDTMKKCILVLSSCSSCQILVKLEFCRQIFEKY